MLAPFFVPRRRVGALRPYKFAKYLPEFGWEPHVVSYDVKGEELTQFEQKALKQTSVYHINLPFDRTTNQSKSDISVNKKEGQKSGSSEGESEKTKKLVDWIERQIPMDSWYPLLRYNQSFMEDLIHKLKPDVLWSTADPWSNLIVARNLKRKFDIPWVADLRDPWSLCPVRYNSKSDHVKPLDRRLEKEVMLEANRIVFTANNTAKLYKDFYPSLSHKISLIHNAFDINEASDVHLNEKIKDDDVITLLFFGKFRSSSPAYVLIEILKEVAKKNSGLLKKVKVLHLGELTPEELSQAKSAGVFEMFEIIPPVPYEHVTEVLNQVDVLVSILNPIRNVVIPSKFWDYLSSGTPIFSIGNNEEMKEILNKTQTGAQFSFEETEKAAEYLSNVIKELKSDESIDQFNPDKSEIEKYSAHSATKKLVHLFQNLTKQKA